MSSEARITAITSGSRRRKVVCADLPRVQDLAGTSIYTLLDGAALALVHTLRVQLSVLSCVLHAAPG